MVKTTKIGGNADYALVPDRLKEFREANPRGKISTSYQLQADGGVIFQATILKDKADDSSAEATGTAMYTAKDMQKAKSFEKLETIAVGRALSLMGYLNNGQVASSEEMEEFEDFKNTQKMESIENAITQLESAPDMDSLRLVFGSLGNLMSLSEVIAAKDKRKAELSEDN